MIVRMEPGRVVARAPAKLNLFLEILGRRGDGYHEIESLITTVDLFDELTFEDDPTGAIALECDDATLPTGEENLVVRAALRVRREAGVNRGTQVRLTKRIPAQAGLGGGSSDAAVTLVALNILWGCGLGPQALEHLAAELGSDVPFFLHSPAGVCRGRGERITPVRPGGLLHFVLVCPPFGLSTADVYRGVRVPSEPCPITPCLEAFLRADATDLGRALFNRLEAPAELLAPDLRRVRDDLQSLGPLLCGHLMSGSGSAHFGLCPDRRAATSAARQLETLGPGSVRVVTCGP